MSHSIVRWLVHPDTWDFVDNIRPDAENPKKRNTASSYGLSKWNTDPDTWEHDYEIFNKPPIISNVSISNINIWANDKNNVFLNCLVNNEDDEGIKYEVFINDIKVASLDNYISTPTELNIEIPNSAFTEEKNLLKLVVFDEAGLESYFKYNIIKENRDIFIFKRIFDFKEDYITDSNIESTYKEGFALKDMGVGSFNLNIPTEGKSKIKNITIDGIEDAQEEITVDNKMIYLKDLGAGKVYESRLLTEYSNINNLETNQIDGRLYYNGLMNLETKKQGRGTVTLYDNYISFYSSTGSSSLIPLGYGITKVDLTKVENIKINWNISGKFGWGATGFLYVSSSSSPLNSDSIVSSIQHTSSAGEIQTEFLDVSNLTGEYYIIIGSKACTTSVYGYKCSVKLYELTLTNKKDEAIYPKILLKFDNKYCTYQNNEFIEVEPTIENFEEYNIDLSQLTTSTDKAILTMEGEEKLGDGKIYRKTIDISKYKDAERIEVK